MREARCVKSHQALLVASCLVAGLSAAGGEWSRERVALSANSLPREENGKHFHLEVWPEGGVLSLRVVDPGRLVVKAGTEVLAASALGWGEDRLLRVKPLEAHPASALPRVVNREAGREEVEVHVPASAGGLLTLTYEWDWKHAGKPALLRTWLLPPLEQDSAVEEDALEEALSEPEWADTPEDEDDVLASLALQEAPFPVQVDPARPELLWVPAPASRDELASRLFGDASAVGAFDFEPLEVPLGAAGLPRVAVRVRHPPALLPGLLAAMRTALDARLEADVAWAVSRLKGASLSRAEAQALEERSLRWAQRSEILDGSGQSYFDRYLQPLAPWRDVGGPARDWSFLGDASEPLRKSIALRSRRWKTRYTVTDGSPVLSPGSVVGRFYFQDGSHVQVRILGLLTTERSLERAELRVRNLPHGGMRLVIPGPDGRFRGHGADFHLVDGAAEPLEHPEGAFSWYYPGTLLIRPEDWRPGMGSGTGELLALRRMILASALASATPQEPQPLLGLDHDVLALLTPEERLGVFHTLLSGAEALEEEAVHLLERVVLSMPAQGFPALERELTSGWGLAKLLGSNAPGKVLLGQAFTQKALASFPLVLDSLDSLPTFHLGREGDTTYLLNVPSGLVSTNLVAPEAWNPRQGVRLEAEPALPGERPGPAQRMALYFEPVRHVFKARYLSAVEESPRSRALHPLEWVRLEVHGPQPRTHLMTALELALLASLPDTSLLWSAVGRLGELHMVHGAMSVLARAPLLPGVAVTRQPTVRQFAGRMSLVTAMVVVDSHRDELALTREGQAFLAVHDVALLALAGRDFSRLATSGLLRELSHRGGLWLRQSGARASLELRESVEVARALARTLERMLAEGKVVATPEGLRFPLPGGADAFKQAFFAIRGEMAAARALGGLRGAGLKTQEAERVLDALKLLGAESPELARAYGAVARRAAALPAHEAQAYLAAVEKLRASARGATRPALAELLHRSGAPSLTERLAFLKEAQWLVGHPELDVEAVGVLAKKAREGRIDLGWLRSTGLASEDLNFMARDKNMPWRLFQRAAEEPGNWRAQQRARERLRGIAGEILAERNARKLFPGYRMTGRQVKLKDGHVIDYELTSMDGSKVRHGVEVKGWNENRWRKALDSWLDRQGGKKLDKEQVALIKQLQRLIDQLADAAKTPRGKPFLVITNKLSGPTRAKLSDFLQDKAPGTLVIQTEEMKMLEKTRQLRAAMRLPEELSGGAP